MLYLGALLEPFLLKCDKNAAPAQADVMGEWATKKI